VLAEFSYLFALWASQVLDLAAQKPESLVCRIRVAKMEIGGHPPRLLPEVLGRVSLVQELTAPSGELDERFEVPIATPPGRLAYELVNRVYQWFGAGGIAIPYSRDTIDGPVLDRASILPE
jgi:hypothetical protein